MPVVERITAREILDSRGRPTVLATCQLSDDTTGDASVPSGASTGIAEAIELRDGDHKRYRGLGCRKAVANIVGEINDSLRRQDFASQSELDRALIALDGTKDKSRLGANAILAVSMAFARTSAKSQRRDLWSYFAEMAGIVPTSLPRLTINLFSGGKHAGQQIAIQDVLLVPTSSSSVDDSLAMSWEVYQIAAEICLRRFGMRLLRADEGGMAPPFRTPEEMIETAIEAIETAGFKRDIDFNLAIDVASSHFHSPQGYQMGDQTITSSAMIDRLSRWIQSYPLVSIEDGLAEDDWENWPLLVARNGRKSLILGDDLLCTNPARIERAVQESSCNALLLKVNQVGTLTEALEALQLARAANWQVTISVRSGETEDTWAADLAVGWAGDQFKNGSVTQSERLAKYNRLLEIESATGFPTNNWPAARS